MAATPAARTVAAATSAEELPHIGRYAWGLGFRVFLALALDTVGSGEASGRTEAHRQTAYRGSNEYPTVQFLRLTRLLYLVVDTSTIREHPFKLGRRWPGAHGIL